MAHRVKSVESQHTLNVSQDYMTSPAREIPDSQGVNTQAAASALVGATETQVIPESYQDSADQLAATSQQQLEDFDELYDTTPRKSSQKVPLKPAHLPQAEHNPPKFKTPALIQSSSVPGSAVTTPPQPGYSSSNQSNSSDCFTSIKNVTSQTEAMTSTTKPGKLAAARPKAGGAVARLHAIRGEVADDVGAAVPRNAGQSREAAQETQQSTSVRPAGDTRKRKVDDTDMVTVTKRTTAAAKVAERPGRKDKPARAAAAKPNFSYELSPPARKKRPKASKAKVARKAHHLEDKETNERQSPDEEQRESGAKTQGRGCSQEDALMISDREIPSSRPEDITRDAQVALTSKTVPPKTPAPVRSSPPKAEFRDQVDDTEMFDQAARSSKKVSIISFSKGGPRNQGVIATSTPGPDHTRSTAPPRSTKALAQGKKDSTRGSAFQGIQKGSHNLKSSNVADSVSQAVGELYRKADDREFLCVDEQQDVPEVPHKPSQHNVTQRQMALPVEQKRAMASHRTLVRYEQHSPQKTLVTPAPPARPGMCPQPPAKADAARPSRVSSQAVQTVDIVGSPVPQGMGIVDPMQTVLEVFSQQETGHSPKHATIAPLLCQPDQQSIVSSNAKAVPASPRAESTALTTMRATESKSKEMLRKDEYAAKISNPFHTDFPFGPGGSSSDELRQKATESATHTMNLGRSPKKAGPPPKLSGKRSFTGATTASKQLSMPESLQLPAKKAVAKQTHAATIPIEPPQLSHDTEPVAPIAPSEQRFMPETLLITSKRAAKRQTLAATVSVAPSPSSGDLEPVAPAKARKQRLMPESLQLTSKITAGKPLPVAAVPVEPPQSSDDAEPSAVMPHRVLPQAETDRRKTPSTDGDEDDSEKTLVDHDLRDMNLMEPKSTECNLPQWTTTLRPHQLTLFDSMVECVQRLAEYMFDQEKGTERMVEEHHRRTTYLIEQEEKQRAREYAVLRRVVDARKQERFINARAYHHDLLVQARDFEREKKQQRKRAAAWDAANDDVESFIKQYW